MDNQDGVWISREEYDRLQQARAGAAANMTPLSPVQAPDTGIDEGPRKWYSVKPIYWLTPLALLSFAFPPLWLVLLALGLLEVHNSLRARRTSLAAAGTGGGSRKSRSPVTALIIVLAGVVILYMFGPLLLIFGFLIIFQIGCMTGLGSCQSV